MLNMISIKEYQEIDFNIDYITNSKKQLEYIKTHINKTLKNVNKLEEKFNEYFKNIKNCFDGLSKEIYYCLKWLNDAKNFNINKNKNIEYHNNYINNIKNNIKKCNDLVKEIDNYDYIKEIKNLNLNLVKTIKDIVELKFYPPKCKELNVGNSILKLIISDMSINTSDSEPFDNYFKDNNESSKDYINRFEYLEISNEQFNGSSSEDINSNNNNNKNVIILNCNSNSKKDSTKEDSNSNNKNSINNNNNINDNDNFLKCSECKTYKAIKKCLHCGKYYCDGCADYVLKYENVTNHIIEKIPNDQLDVETIRNKFLKNCISIIKTYLLKCNYLLNLNPQNIKFDFPEIENINDFESQKKFLNQINKLSPNLDDNINDNENNLEINSNIINSLENIFKNKKLHLSNNIQDIDDDFYSEEKYNINEKQFEKIKNNLLYFITIVSKENISIENDLLPEIKEEFSNNLAIEQNNIFILLNDNVNNFVKSEQFSILPYNQILYENPLLEKLKEIKLLIEKCLCAKCFIPNEYFDYRGNTLNPNLSCNLIRGNEIYDPPYGWYGIGLNVEKIYGINCDNCDWFKNNPNSNWAIAYHGITSKLSSDKIMKILKIIITRNGIKIGKSKLKSNCNDIRHWGKVGEGIYLSPKINIAEHYTGTILFNNKKYKVLFMVKVYKNAIREPEYTNFWVLDEKYIKIYRILFKEIN